MLETDPDKRPDIFQVSCIAFYLKDPSRDCPVRNLEVTLKFFLIYLLLCSSSQISSKK